MLNKLFPSTIGDSYRGHPLALWLLALVLLVKVAQIVSVLVDGQGIVASADGIPLDTFSAEGARTVVAAFVGMAISRLLICLVCALVLWRYRSAVTAIFLLLVVHDIARELVLRPVRRGIPIGQIVNIALIVVAVAGLALAAPRPSKP
jgi:hypothetical protein